MTKKIAVTYTRDARTSSSFTIHDSDTDICATTYTVVLIPQEETNPIDDVRRENPDRVDKIEQQVKKERNTYKKHFASLPVKKGH